MEEEKAEEYYNELLRKGGNAAKLKQGLGFSTDSSEIRDSKSVSNREEYGSLSIFVRGDQVVSDEYKEIDIRSIRDKIKKRRASRARSPKGDGKKALDRTETEELSRRKVPGRVNGKAGFGSRSPSLERKQRASAGNSDDERRGRSRSPRKRSSRRKVWKSSRDTDSRTERAPVKKKSDNERRGPSRSPRRRSSGRKISESSSDTDSRRERRIQSKKNSVKERRGHSPTGSKERKVSKSSSSDSPSSNTSGKSYEERQRESRRRGRDRSANLTDDRRSRLGPKSSIYPRNRKPSSSYERRKRNGKRRSRSHGRDSYYKGWYRREEAYYRQESRRRDRSRSPLRYRESYDSRHESRRRDRSRSPLPFRKSYDSPTENRSTRRSYSPPLRHTDRTREYDRRDERSSRKDGKTSSRTKESSKLKPNSDTMTPAEKAEKLKAKTKLELEHWKKSTAAEWELFNREQPLADTAKLDSLRDENGAIDSIDPNDTGLSHLSTPSQIKKKALVMATHEASIFGPPEGISLRRLERVTETGVGDKRFATGGSLPSDSQVISKIINDEEEESKIAAPLLNKQVIAMQNAGSWQDRARKRALEK